MVIVSMLKLRYSTDSMSGQPHTFRHDVGDCVAMSSKYSVLPRDCAIMLETYSVLRTAYSTNLSSLRKSSSPRRNTPGCGRMRRDCCQVRRRRIEPLPFDNYYCNGWFQDAKSMDDGHSTAQ